MPEDDFDWPVLATWLLFAFGAALTFAARVRDRWGRALRRFDVALFGIVGLAGTIIAWLWLGTEHSVTGPNWNLLWAWPTHLVAAIVLARRNRSGWLWVYWALATVVTLAAVLLWPVLPQALHAAVLPLALLLVLRAGAHALAARSEPSPAL
jgi:hypothetical protein